VFLLALLGLLHAAQLHVVVNTAVDVLQGVADPRLRV
jgi:hypothetical protein